MDRWSFAAIAWRKSSASSGNGGQCVEAGTATDQVAIRDSKHLESGMIFASSPEWASLLNLVSDDDCRVRDLAQGDHA